MASKGDSQGEVVLRVAQLDAVELNEELTDVLQNQFVRLFSSSLATTFKPELKAFVRWLLWRYSVQSNNQTFGQRIMGLKFSVAEDRHIPIKYFHKAFLFVSMVLLEWACDRSDFLSSSVLPRLGRAFKHATALVKALSLLNFISFLLGGRFPTLLQRMLGLHMIPVQRQTLRQMSYELMNREILWHGFAEFLFFVLPQLNVFAFKNWFRKHLAHYTAKPVELKNLSNSDYKVCHFCKDAPTMPCVTNCGHVYCYYCIKSNCLADRNFPCSVCGTAILNTTSLVCM